jgi:hypothetical protein
MDPHDFFALCTYQKSYSMMLRVVFHLFCKD